MTKSSNKYQAVLFDLDGTLIDTAPDFVLCLNLLRQEQGLTALSDTNVRKVVSDGARAMISLAFGIKEGDAGFEQKKLRFLDLYEQHIAEKSELFSGLEQCLLLCQEQNIPWGIITNKPRKYSELLLTKLGLMNSLATLVCADDVINAKPDKEPMLKACNEISLSTESCLYVGDHKRDIDAGKNANMPTIAAAYGYVHNDDEAESWQANWTVQSGEELHSLLIKLFPKDLLA